MKLVQLKNPHWKFIKFSFLFCVVFNSQTCNNLACNNTRPGQECKTASELSPFDIVITIGVNILNKSICVLIKDRVNKKTYYMKVKQTKI
jgi:hypothetical protein